MRILTTPVRSRTLDGKSTYLSKFGFAFGLLSAAAATVALLIVNAGSSDPESVGYFRTFIAGSIGNPATWVALLAGTIGLISLMSHKRHGMPLTLPVATLALSAFSFVICATLAP
jgi:hypothetical protein